MTQKNREVKKMFEFLDEYETRDDRHLMQKLQAIMFISEKPLTLDDFCSALQEEPEEVERSLADLEDYLSQDKSALELREVAGGYQLFTKRNYFGACESFLLDQNKRKLSASSIETLAIIAYSQPVTRAQVAEIRGVNSDSLITTLINKGYVFESGVSEEAGNPALISTTEKFLNAFGFTSLDEMPPLEDFAPDEEARIAIAERLGALSSRNSASSEDTDIANP